MKPNRPKDLIDFIEEMAAKDGNFLPVGEDYYQAFLDLSQPQVEKLAVAVMLALEKEVRRLAAGKTDPAAVARVGSLIQNAITTISLGIARFDVFGRLGFVARVGPEPWDVDMDEPLERRYAEIAPIIENTVRRTLPWLLSREVTQGQLPL